ncbi:hypothetical protein VTO42DRAFT_3912 [Malbranchea cinnamomea]
MIILKGKWHQASWAVRAGGEAYLATPQLLRPPAESLPDWLEDFQDVFSAKKAAELPPIDGPTHAIELKEGAEPPYMPICNLSQKELETLRKYLEDSIGMVVCDSAWTTGD